MRKARKRPDTRDEQKAALLDAFIDEELSRPDEEQDPEAIAEWSGMIDELTGGAYRPTRAEKRRLLKVMKAHRKAERGQRKRIRPRTAAAVICVLLAVLLLPAAAFAKEIRSALDDLFLRLKPQINALEEGECLVVHTENTDVLIIKGDFGKLQTPEELADYLRVPVLWPGWLPDGVKAGEIRLHLNGDGRYYLIPWQNGFAFTIEVDGIRDPYPETMTAAVCGEETEISYYLNGEGGGGGNFFHGGLLYSFRFSSLDDAERFLDGLVEVQGGRQ